MFLNILLIIVHYHYYKVSKLIFTCLLLIIPRLSASFAYAQAQGGSFHDCSVTLKNDVLTLSTSSMSRSYQWNNGDLRSLSISDRSVGYTWPLAGNLPDVRLPGVGQASHGTLNVMIIPESPVVPAHLEATVTVSMGTLEVKRIFRLYPRCPAIACDFYLRGQVNTAWLSTRINNGDLRNVENNAALKEGSSQPTILETLALPGRHWRVKATEFFDVTDRNNNLLQTTGQLLYRAESRLRGNLLFADELLSDHGLFILKEAPTSDAQLAYPGFDFLTRIGSVQLAGFGVLPHDLDKEHWVRCYGFVTGVTSGGLLGRLAALRTYQQQVRRHLPGRDDMILMNTWGDRNQDKKIGEKFTLKEIEAAHRLGITHFQIDDGWQTGRSGASAFGGGSLTRIWANPDYWKPDPAKFPHGLGPIVALGRKLGVEVCLWFNPSQDSSYAHWLQDAKVLISLYRQYGIRTFKIDGVQVTDKRGEVNLRKMLDTVLSVTKNQAVFNLDVTAGRRYGYHYFNQYGNIFLENRYTDWAGYYPHWTLRNLWLLSQYVPPQNLQIEFLNNYRNQDKYPPDDVLAPGKVGFEYEFALTMMAQPLAWFEATGLPEKAFQVAPVIKSYQKLQAEIHAGQILPIGEEPSGTSWTGFQSIQGTHGFLLIIRELTTNKGTSIKTWLPPGKRVQLTALLGKGRCRSLITGKDGSISVSIPQSNNYTLYKYQILNK